MAFFGAILSIYELITSLARAADAAEREDGD